MSNVKLSFKILKQRMVVFVLVVISFFIPQLSENQNSIDIRAMITALGIDKKGDEYEVTAQLFVPSKSQPNKDIISAKDKTISLAAEQLYVKTARLAVESTCALIMLGKDLVEQENVMPVLDYLVRNNVITWNALVAVSDQEASKALVELNKLESKSPIGWLNFFDVSNRGYDYAAVQLRDFIKGVYGITGTSYCPLLTTEKIPSEGQGGTGGSGGGGNASGGGGDGSQGSFNPIKNDGAVFTQSSGSSGGSEGGSSGGSSGGGSDEKKGQAPQLKLEGKTNVFVKGKKIAELNKDETEGMNWMNEKAVFHSIKLSDVGGYYFRDGDITLGIINKKLKIKSQFDSNPTVIINMKIQLDLEEVMQSDIPLVIGKNDVAQKSKSLNQKTAEYIEQKIRHIFEKSKELKADVLELVPLFNKYHNKKFKKFLETGRQPIDILDEIELKFELLTEVEV